uniref:Extracellular matrix protein 1 n=1 Tax=Strix occidentalis caurina TaxID=311401 RepID=A0A8D0EQ62_STROC
HFSAAGGAGPPAAPQHPGSGRRHRGLPSPAQHPGRLPPTLAGGHRRHPSLPPPAGAPPDPPVAPHRLRPPAAASGRARRPPAPPRRLLPPPRAAALRPPRRECWGTPGGDGGTPRARDGGDTWTEVLDDFCTDEFGVKTRQFHCCRRHDAARRRCFAQGPSGATAEAVAIVTARDPRAEPPFPPGEPTAANMANICGLRGLRPGPPGAGGPSGPRVRFRLRLERDYGRCCRNGSLACARDAWQKGLQRFCREESAVKTRQHRCCQPRGAPARSRCFAAAAPHPAYDRELHNVSLARLGPALLRTLCGPTRLFTKRRPVPELLGAVTATCCPLPPEEQSACAQEQLSQGIATLCDTSRDTWRDPQGCCSRGGPERRRCFDTTYLAQVTLGITSGETESRGGALGRGGCPGLMAAPLLHPQFYFPPICTLSL